MVLACMANWLCGYESSFSSGNKYRCSKHRGLEKGGDFLLIQKEIPCCFADCRQVQGTPGRVSFRGAGRGARPP